MTARRVLRGFTIIELLTVVAILSLLMAILLPSLSRAREQGRRVVCLANARHLTLGLNSYRTEDAARHFPAAPSWAEAVYSSVSYHGGDHSELGRPFGRAGYMDGWLGMGLLVHLGHVRDPELFYCPNVRESEYLTYPVGWDLDDPRRDDWAHSAWAPRVRWYSYSYRVFGQRRGSIGAEDIAGLYALPPSPTEAIVSDMFLNWYGYLRGPAPHTSPFGLNVGFADGHGEFVRLGEDEYRRCAYASLENKYVYEPFFLHYFRALGGGDFSAVDAFYPVP